MVDFETDLDRRIGGSQKISCKEMKDTYRNWKTVVKIVVQIFHEQVMTIMLLKCCVHVNSFTSSARMRYDIGIVLFSHISAMFHTCIAGANRICQPEIS